MGTLEKRVRELRVGGLERLESVAAVGGEGDKVVLLLPVLIAVMVQFGEHVVHIELPQKGAEQELKSKASVGAVGDRGSATRERNGWV